MRARARAALAAWTLTAATMAGCGSSDNYNGNNSDSSSISRGDALTDLAAEAIVPAYERMATSARGLQRAAEALCDATQSGTSRDIVQARLDKARAALADTLTHWSFLEAMWTGPVMHRRSWAVIDWPVDTEEIETLIADSEPIDTERLALRIGADQRGLRAVEHILSTAAAESTVAAVDTAAAESTAAAVDTAAAESTAAAVDTAAGVVAALDDRRRCDYLIGITEVIAEEAGLLYEDWTVAWEGGPAYPSMWAAPDGGDGVDDLVNGSLFLLEAISDRELGAAVGLMNDPTETREASDAREPAVLVVTDMRNHLRGLRAVLVGDGPSASGGNRGLGPLLGTKLPQRLHDLLKEAESALSVLPPRLRTTPGESLEDIEHARDAVKAIQVAVATEVVSRLGVAIGFSDADGDSTN